MHKIIQVKIKISQDFELIRSEIILSIFIVSWVLEYVFIIFKQILYLISGLLWST